MYKNENGRYMVRETEPEQEQGILGFSWEQGLDKIEGLKGWKILREYEGRFSAEEAIGEIIRVHREGRINA